MRVSTLVSVTLTLGATFAWFGVQSSGAAERAKPAVDLAKAKVVYDARCGTVCHAKGGIGTFNLEKRLGAENSVLADRSNLSVELIEHVVRHGIASMPYLTRAELPDSELELISAYLTRPAQQRK
jgi:mono/diheme cytochrome c family protein